MLVFRVYASVKDDRLVAREDGGGAGPAAVLVEGLLGKTAGLRGFQLKRSVEKECAHTMFPHSAPCGCIDTKDGKFPCST